MTKWLSQAGATLARGIALFGLWMVFVDNVHQPELVTGAVTATATALLWTVVVVARGERARVSRAMLRYLYRPFVSLVTDSVRVTAALIAALVLRRPLRGHFRAVHYRSVTPDRDARARRILTEWAASVGANRYAIGIEPTARYLLVHELVRHAGPLDPLELG